MNRGDALLERRRSDHPQATRPDRQQHGENSPALEIGTDVPWTIDSSP